MIPRVIHYCWFGDGELSEMAIRCINSWKEKCPDYTIKKWTEKDFDMKQYPYMREAYEEKAWGFVPDIARLIIILNEGGVYFDTDVELLKPIDELLDNKAFFGFENITKVNLGQGFGAEPHNKVIYEMLNAYKDRHFRHANGEIDKTPSPYIQTETLKKLGMKLNGGMQKVEGAMIYPSDFFCPLDFDTGECVISSNTVSIHHFDGSWLDDYQRTMIELKRQTLIANRGIKGKLVWQYIRIKERIKKDGLIGSLRLLLRKIKYE